MKEYSWESEPPSSKRTQRTVMVQTEALVEHLDSQPIGGDEEYTRFQVLSVAHPNFNLSNNSTACRRLQKVKSGASPTLDWMWREGAELKRKPQCRHRKRSFARCLEDLPRLSVGMLSHLFEFSRWS